MAVHDLLKSREHNQNKAVEGFDKVNNSWNQSGHYGGHLALREDAAAAPGDRIADATTALWSKNAGAHLSTDFEIQNVRVLALQVVLDSALAEFFNCSSQEGRSCSAAPQARRSTTAPWRALGALPLPRHGAQHRHRPRWLPALQFYRRLPDGASAQDAP